ncbi:MAG: hypothetical protein AAFX81_05620 [Pseudomonadota bacterium]
MLADAGARASRSVKNGSPLGSKRREGLEHALPNPRRVRGSGVAVQPPQIARLGFRAVAVQANQRFGDTVGVRVRCHVPPSRLHAAAARSIGSIAEPVENTQPELAAIGRSSNVEALIRRLPAGAPEHVGQSDREPVFLGGLEP